MLYHQVDHYSYWKVPKTEERERRSRNVIKMIMVIIIMMMMAENVTNLEKERHPYSGIPESFK